MSGTGDEWFTSPVSVPQGLYFAGYGPSDANPDLGDSAITETAGIGGVRHGGRAGHRPLRRGDADGCLELHAADVPESPWPRNPDQALPALGFSGTPTAIDARRVVESGDIARDKHGHRPPRAGNRADRRRDRPRALGNASAPRSRNWGGALDCEVSGMERRAVIAIGGNALDPATVSVEPSKSSSRTLGKRRATSAAS